MRPSLMRRILERTAMTAALGVVAAGLGTAVAGPASANSGSLQQVTGFGSNPGNLSMYEYAPANLPANAPLVVALHGCTQSANDYYANSGWPKFADLYGFAMVFPQQSSSNNSLSCFSWFDNTKDTRGNGEAASIKAMVDHAEAQYGSNPRRVYVTGLSAGAGMTADLLADYPDVFAAGAIDAGLPAQCATTQGAASGCQNNNQNLTPAQWGDKVRNSDPGYSGPWPRVAIWHGSSDTTVYPVNSTELRDQWTNVWGIGQSASSTQSLTGGTTESSYNDAGGKPAVELYSISGMSHGTAVNPGSATDQCGTTGTYYPDYICSSYYTAQFWGLNVTGPAAPTGLAVTGTTNTSASLSWNSVSGAASYDVYRNGVKVNTSVVTGTGYTDTGLTAGTSYSDTVAAVDGSGNVGSQSAAVNATTTGTAPTLPAPTGLTVGTVTGNSIALSWNTVSGAAGYDVYRNGVKVNTSVVTGTGYTDTGLTAGTSYSDTVAAVDGSGNVGTQSAAVNATTSSYTPTCYTAANYTQVRAGRAHDSGGIAYANGSNQNLGLDNVFYTHTLEETSPGYYAIADTRCPA